MDCECLASRIEAATTTIKRPKPLEGSLEGYLDISLETQYQAGQYDSHLYITFGGAMGYSSGRNNSNLKQPPARRECHPYSHGKTFLSRYIAAMRALQLKASL